MHITVESILSRGFIEQPMFHPKIAMFPDGRLIMTIQSIGGSDFYGPVLQSFSDDNGHNWTTPTPIPPFAWSEPDDDGVFSGVCDTVPDFDSKSGRMLAIGHQVFNTKGRFLDTTGFFVKGDRRTDLRRRGIYTVRNEDGTWSPARTFDPPEYAECPVFMCGCTQKVIHPDGRWLIPFYFKPSQDITAYRVVVLHTAFDGNSFTVTGRSNELTLLHKRGLLEPSLMEYDGRLFLTLRAEDGFAYWSISEDGGITFSDISPWRFDDDTPLVTSTTQQHFLRFGGALHLTYVRNNGQNAGVTRFRAPIYICRIDTTSMRLIRDTEQVLIPLDGDWRRPDTVLFGGNFMPCSLSENEALLAEGAIRPKPTYTGITRIARIFR